jgi:hypothetical protein
MYKKFGSKITMKNGEKIENYYEWHYVMEKYI